MQIKPASAAPAKQDDGMFITAPFGGGRQNHASGDSRLSAALDSCKSRSSTPDTPLDGVGSFPAGRPPVVAPRKRPCWTSVEVAFGTVESSAVRGRYVSSALLFHRGVRLQLPSIRGGLVTLCSRRRSQPSLSGSMQEGLGEAEVVWLHRG